MSSESGRTEPAHPMDTKSSPLDRSKCRSWRHPLLSPLRPPLPPPPTRGMRLPSLAAAAREPGEAAQRADGPRGPAQEPTAAEVEARDAPERGQAGEVAHEGPGKVAQVVHEREAPAEFGAQKRRELRLLASSSPPLLPAAAVVVFGCVGRPGTVVDTTADTAAASAAVDEVEIPRCRPLYASSSSSSSLPSTSASTLDSPGCRRSSRRRRRRRRRRRCQRRRFRRWGRVSAGTAGCGCGCGCCGCGGCRCCCCCCCCCRRASETSLCCSPELRC